MAQPHLCAAAIGARPERRCRLEEKLVTMRAGGCDHLDLVGAGMDAMRQRQPVRQETDVTEVADDAIRKMPVRPGALIDGFKQMHMDAAAGLRRILRHRLQQRF